MSISERDQDLIAETLCHLSAVTNAPSSMGAQLDQLSSQSEAKRHGPGWGTHAKGQPAKVHDAEATVLRHAKVYRLVTSLARVKAVDLEVPSLVAISLEHVDGLGRVVVRTLRAFQSALAAPSDEELERANVRAAKATPERRDEVRQRAIAEYRAPRGLEAVQELYALKTSAHAAELYADCLLVLSMYVQQFNRKAAA
jgi:hypothetical protein